MEKQTKILYILIRRIADVIGLLLLIMAVLFALRG